MVRFSRRPAAGQDAPSVADVLRQSGLVDAEWYRETYADVAAEGLDPATHYAASGADEGRDPNAFFDGAWYLGANADVREAGLNPLHHYVVAGAAEGRSAGPAFDTAYYLSQNPEVASSGMNPLLHYLHYGRHEGRTAVPFDEAEAFEAGLRAKHQGLTGAAAALFSGARGASVHFELRGRGEAKGGALPLPPLRLAQRIGSVTLEDFEHSGREIRDTIVRAMPEGFSWPGSRCLDFGSGVGRALRHFGGEAERAEFWGCDIDGSSIRWSVENLSPPFRFFQIGEVPTLPFEDNSFDLVYAISVLSHIHSTWHQWLMEIRRVLKPGGVFFVSFMGQTPMEEMTGESYWERGAGFGMYVRNPHQNWNDGGPMIFVSPAWIKTFWGSLFDIDYIAMEGLMDYQSFALLRKPAVGAPIRRDMPVLKLSTSQAFDPDAVGHIHAQVDPQKPYRRSYGIDLQGRREALIEGWIVFRGDTPEEIDLLVDGRAVPARAVFGEPRPYRDWASEQVSFAVEVDFGTLPAGIHKLQASIRSRGGRVHALTIPLLVR